MKVFWGAGEQTLGSPEWCEPIFNLYYALGQYDPKEGASILFASDLWHETPPTEGFIINSLFI